MSKKINSARKPSMPIPLTNSAAALLVYGMDEDAPVKFFPPPRCTYEFKKPLSVDDWIKWLEETKA